MVFFLFFFRVLSRGVLGWGAGFFLFLCFGASCLEVWAYMIFFSRSFGFCLFRWLFCVVVLGFSMVWVMDGRGSFL